MGRLAFILVALFLTLAPGAALASPASDSVGMRATVVESCTISPEVVGAFASGPDAERRVVALGCGGDGGASFDRGEPEANAWSGERSYVVRYERDRDGARSMIATIIF